MGDLVLGATERGICFLQFRENGISPELTVRDAFNGTVDLAPQASDLISSWINEISAYLRGDVFTLRVPLDVTGTSFQVAVWDFLQAIPRGATMSYQAVARGIERPSAIRAVANACASNRVAILIPCHRVVRENGDLAGYRWGLERKRALLALESCRNRSIHPCAGELTGESVSL